MYIIGLVSFAFLISCPSIHKLVISLLMLFYKKINAICVMKLKRLCYHLMSLFMTYYMIFSPLNTQVLLSFMTYYMFNFFYLLNYIEISSKYREIKFPI